MLLSDSEVNDAAFRNAVQRFLEAASVAEKWRQLSPLEFRTERAVGKAFRAQGSTFLRKFATLKPKLAESERLPGSRLREALTDEDWLRIFDETTEATFEIFLAALQGNIATALQLGAGDIIGHLAIDYAFGLRHPRAEVYMREHGSALITAINEVTRGNIQTILAEGIREGWSYDRIARAISQMYSEMAVGKPQQHIDSRAHLIAVTELGNAYEEGTLTVVRDLQNAGLMMEKQWLTVGDNRVSAGCKTNQAEGWIPLDQAFSSGHQRPLRFPGCRCTALYQRHRN